MDPAAIPSRPLGQLLVERAVITADQLEQVLTEQEETGRPLRDLIVGRGFATGETVDRALGSGSGDVGATEQASNVIAFTDTARGRSTSSADGDVEWRRKLFGLVPAEEETAATDEPAPVPVPAEPPETTRGRRGKLARSLEAYLARTAAELDERGEALQRRSIALEEESRRVANAEAALESRAARLRGLDLAGRDVAAQIDELLALVADKDKAFEQITVDRDAAQRELELVQDELSTVRAESADRDHVLSSTERRAAELSEELDGARTHREQLERDLAERDEALTRLERANTAHLNDIAALQSALAAAREESAQRERQRAAVEQERAALDEELERERGRLDTLEENLARRDEKLTRLEEANESQLRDLAAAQKEIAGHTTRIAELEQKLDERQRELSAARSRLHGAEQENAELMSSREQQLRDLAERTAEIGDLQTRLDEARRRQGEGNTRLEELNAQLTEREERLNLLLEGFAEHEQELQRVRQSQAEQEAAFDSVVAELAERQRLLFASERKADALGEQLDAVRASLRSIDGDPRPADPAAEQASALAGERHDATKHLCFVPVAGSYTLVERSGPLPKPGDQVSDDAYGGRRFVVSRVGRSPLPLDERMCAYLEALE